MGMASSAGLNSLAHSVTFGINLAVFTNLAQYLLNRSDGRRGPFWCIIAATILVMGDLTRHLINDANNWFLVDVSGDKQSHYSFDFDNCVYSIPVIQGSSKCTELGLGPLIVSEENALGVDGMSMYGPDGSLSVYGWVFTILGTWTGFALLFIGIMWHTGIVSKLRRQYSLLRGARDQVTEAFLTPESRPAEPAI